MFTVMRKFVSSRLLLGLAVVVAVPTFAAPSALAAPANPESIHAYSAPKGDPANPAGWSATSAGTVRFFSGNRRFDIVGSSTYHRPPGADVAGYLQYRQNLQNTTSDPEWKQNVTDVCDSDLSVPDITFLCTHSTSVNQTTAPTRKLAGIWIRVCRHVPFRCSPGQYLDNPYT